MLNVTTRADANAIIAEVHDHPGRFDPVVQTIVEFIDEMEKAGNRAYENSTAFPNEDVSRQLMAISLDAYERRDYAMRALVELVKAQNKLGRLAL